MDYWFIAAGVLSAAITAIHIFAGGADVAQPLLATREMDRTVKYTVYYCWHLVSFSLALMAAGFIASGAFGASDDLAILMTALAVGFTLWGLILPPRVGQSYKEMPQGWLFLPVAVCGLAGLL
ncbi:MAG: hypothetical protein ACPGGK_09010 [Pikeienuella sp.]